MCVSKVLTADMRLCSGYIHILCRVVTGIKYIQLELVCRFSVISCNITVFSLIWIYPIYAINHYRGY